MFPDLSVPIRSAIVADANVRALLPIYLGSYPVFTRQPVPNDAPSPNIVVSDNRIADHEDGVNDQRLLITRDVTVSGDPETDWRTVDAIARQVVVLFHRRQSALIVPGWTVHEVQAAIHAGQPTALDQTVSVVVNLTIRLAARP